MFLTCASRCVSVPDAVGPAVSAHFLLDFPPLIVLFPSVVYGLWVAWVCSFWCRDSIPFFAYIKELGFQHEKAKLWHQDHRITLLLLISP